MEGDAKAIINAINGDTMFLSKYGHILQDIKLVSSFACSVSFCHIRRQENCVTHRLARRAICNPFLIWMEDVPSDILNVYNFDLSMID